jgi:uncharacterized membrane protein
VAVSLLLIVALVVTAAQVRWLGSRSADVQNVADSAALASANMVCEVQTSAQLADATLLSLGLLGLGIDSVGVVAACVPGGQGAAKALFKLGGKTFKARDKAAKAAVKARKRCRP